MLTALVKPRVRVGNEWVSKGQNVDQVSWAIGAMSKVCDKKLKRFLLGLGKTFGVKYRILNQIFISIFVYRFVIY